MKLVNIVSDRIKRIKDKYDFINSTKNRFLKITIGASGISQKGWVASEKDYLNLLKEDDWKKYFKENSINVLLAEHVWEHLTEKEGIFAAKVCFKYLKQRGYLRVAVPDGLFPSKIYLNHVRPGSNDLDTVDHKTLFTYKSLSKLFEKAGFKIRLLEYFDEKGKFHYKEWKIDEGMIVRSKKYDERNYGGKLNYTSIILDAIKT